MTLSWSQESIPPAYEASRYDNPILIRFLAPIDYSKIPAQDSNQMKSTEGRKELWYGRCKVERNCGTKGVRWKGDVVWKVEGGKEM